MTRRKALAVVLVCTGRARDKYARPVPGREGERCGKQYVAGSGTNRARAVTDARLIGWSVGPDGEDQQVMCPTCRG